MGSERIRERRVTGGRLTGALVLLAVATAGCGDGAEAPNAGRPERVEIGATTFAACAPIFVAEEQGYFADEGLDASITIYPAGKAALADVVAGKLDFATVAETPIVNAVLAGQEFKVIATVAEVDRANYIVARKDRGIFEAADLKGKRLGYTPGTTGDYFQHIFLTTSRVDPSGVVHVAIESGHIADALLDGEVDAVSTWPPFASDLEEALGDNAVVLDEPGLYVMAWNIATSAGSSVSSRTVEGFLRALIRADEYMAQHPQEARMTTAERTGATSASLQKLWPSFTWRVGLDQSLLMSLEDEARWMSAGTEGPGRTPVVPLVMAVGVVAGLAASNRIITGLHEREARAVQIGTGLNELNDLARAYVATHEERPREQFEVKHREVVQLIAEERNRDSGGGQLLAQMETEVGFVGSLFARIVDNYEQGGTLGDPLFVEAEQRLAGQLFLRARNANATSGRLTIELGRKIVETQESALLLGTGYTSLAAIVLTIALLTLLRSVSASIGRLAEGTEVVGGGDLAHRTVLDTHDELSELARSFNRMTARLQNLTVSAADLELEVERRTRTARELDAERRQLETILGSMTEGVGVWAADGRQVRINQAAARMHGFDDPAEMLRHLSEFADVTLRTIEGEEVAAEEWPAARVLRGETFSNVIVEVSVRSTGATFIGSYGGQPIRDENGELLLGVITLHDMSDVYAAQERERLELATTQVLLQVAAALSTWTDLDSLLRDLADLVLKAVEHKRVTIGIVDDEAQMLRLPASAGEVPVPPGTCIPLAEVTHHVTSMLAGGRTTLIDYDALPEDERANVSAHAGRLVMYAPIVYGGAALGYIAIDDPGGRRPFAPREVDIVEAMASQAAIAVENARRYLAEHDIAERLQAALLEMPATMSGIELECMYRSASQTARVGGDFYDLFDMDAARVGITIGDVAGKGLSAAAMTSLVKNAVRANAGEQGRGPAEVLRATNDFMVRSTPSGTYVTVWFGILDRDSGDLRYAGAGHPPGIIVRCDGTAEKAAATGPILGAFSGVQFEDGSSRLDPGDLLFLYTDGLSEARRLTELFGEDRVVDALRRRAGSTPEVVVREVAEEALNFTGGELLDDLAILVLRRTAPSP